MNLHLPSRDVGMNGGTLTDNQDIGSLDGTMDVPIDAKCARETKFSGQGSSLVKETFELIGIEFSF